MPVLGLPLAPLEPALDPNRTPFGEEARAVVALRPPDLDVEEVGLVLPLAGRAVFAARIDGDPQVADRRTARQRTQLRVAGQISSDHDDVQVASGHLSSFDFALSD